MSFTPNPGFPNSFKTGQASWTNSDAINTKKTLYTAGADGAMVKALFGTSTETLNSRLFRIYLTISGVDYLMNANTVGTNAGANGSTAPTNFLNTTIAAAYMWDAYGNKVLIMPASSILKAENRAVLTASTQIDIMAQVLEF